MKKFMSILLSAALAASVLAACVPVIVRATHLRLHQQRPQAQKALSPQRIPRHLVMQPVQPQENRYTLA